MELKNIDFRRGLLLSLSLSVISIVAIVLLTIDHETILYLQRVQPLFLFLAFVVMVLMWLVEAQRIRVMAGTLDENVSVVKALYIFLAGSFGANVTPFTSGGGPLQIFLLHREGISLARSTTIVVVRVLMRMLIFAVLAPTFYFLFHRLINRPSFIGASLINILFLAAIAITLLALFLIFKPHMVTVFIRTIFSLPLLHRAYEKEWVRRGLTLLRDEIEEFNRSIRLVAARRKTGLFLVTFLTFLYWMLYFSIIPVILMGLGFEPHFFEAYVIQTVFFLLLPFMPTPGASGVAELGLVALFSNLIPGSMLGILAALWRFFTYYLVMALGGLFVLKTIKEIYE